MPKDGQVGGCSKHQWARLVPCEGCERDNEASRLVAKARRDKLAMELLVAHVAKYGCSDSRVADVRSELCSRIISLADEMLTQLDGKKEVETYEHP